MITLKFIIIQLIGVLSWLILIISYYRKTTNKILVFQIIGTILCALHYYLLGANIGMLICIFEILRDYAYYKTKYDKYIFVLSIPIYIIFGIFSCRSIIDILPIFSSLLSGYSLTKKRKSVVLGGIIEYTLKVIYDVYVMSISSAIADILIVLSNLSILLFKKSLFKNSKLKKLIC